MGKPYPESRKGLHFLVTERREGHFHARRGRLNVLNQLL